MIDNGAPRPMEEAPPRDGTLLRLWVRGGTNRLDDVCDSDIWETVGFCFEELNEEPGWHILGWCWSHDHITESEEVEIVAWGYLNHVLPAHFSSAAWRRRKAGR